VRAAREAGALDYVRESIRLIQRWLDENPDALLDENRMAGNAILWRLLTLADVTGRPSDELQARHPNIP
jgi:uncharacterized protein with HEPN domain